MHGDIIAKRFKGFGWKFFIDAFDFLQTGHIGRGLAKPVQHAV